MVADANGRVRLARLAEFMRSVVADYAVPRSRLAAARERDHKHRSTSAVATVISEARNTFTDLEKTGEGGELLLYLLAERFLKFPQVLCKMDLKTDPRLHYHGADGVYADVREDGVLKLYWSESKIYGDAASAIREALASLAPFLIEPDNEQAERERDLVLLSDKADLEDPILTGAFRQYFDKSSPKSNRVQYCGIALVGFDADCYPQSDVQAVTEDIASAAELGLSSWQRNISNRLIAEALEAFEIHVLCIPLPSAEKFRDEFLKSLGLK